MKIVTSIQTPDSAARENRYHLWGMLIIESIDPELPFRPYYNWSQVVRAGKHSQDRHRRKAFLDVNNDILFLTPWKSPELKTELGSLEQAVDSLRQLPRWEKSRYWRQSAPLEFGRMFECRSGKSAEIPGWIMEQSVRPISVE